MNRILSIPGFLALLFVLVLAEGCRIEITVPEGGDVVSTSGAYDCASGNACVVEVNDFHFDETFEAHAREGWVFIGWKLGPDYLCIHGACRLSTKGFEQYENLSSVVESDEIFYLEPEFVKGTPFDEAIANVQDQELRNCLERHLPPRDYAEQVREIYCSNYYHAASLQGLEAFVGIKRLSVATDRSLTDLQPLSKLSRLQYLGLELGSDYFNAAALGDLKLLYHLKLNMNILAWVRRNDEPDLTEMFHLQSLRKLELVDVDSDHLNSIGSLVNLRELVIDPVNTRSRISDLSPLAGLTKLESLKIELLHHTYGNEISDIKPLTGLKKLKTLELSNNQISNINPLAGLTNLESLALSSNEISDISPLAVFKKLETLELSSNQISDINPLAGIDSIPVLDLSDNLVSDVSALRKLYPVTLDPGFYVDIDLSRNPITSTGNTLDGIRAGWVWLLDVPLTCQEYSQLAEQYASRLIVAHPDATYYAPRYSVPGFDLSLFYIPPRDC